MFEQSRIFYENFCKIFEKESDFRKDAINKYIHNKDFTDFVIEKINKIIREQGYIAQNEYFRIDAIGYKTHWDNTDKMKKFNCHIWDLQIAVEHENDPADWLDEVVKLAHIYCPVRIVIGYVPFEQRPYGDVERLEYATNILQKLKCKNNLTNGEFMVILGNSNTKGNMENYFNYKAYVLNNENFNFESIDKFI